MYTCRLHFERRIQLHEMQRQYQAIVSSAVEGRRSSEVWSDAATEDESRALPQAEVYIHVLNGTLRLLHSAFLHPVVPYK